METKKGLIGFFDILGYQNLLKNNKAAEIAEKVIPILKGCPKKAKASVEKSLKSSGPAPGKSDPDHWIQQLLNIKTLVFSDTILITFADADSQDENDAIISDYLFLFFCIELQRAMFENGLPLRGVIHYGEYYVEDACFAGEIIVEAYTLCNELELAGCVIHKDAENKIAESNHTLTEHFGFNPLFAMGMVFDYFVPIKSGEIKMAALAFHRGKEWEGESIRDYILRSFWGNNKDIPKNVLDKIANTEQWIRFQTIKRKELAKQALTLSQAQKKAPA